MDTKALDELLKEDGNITLDVIEQAEAELAQLREENAKLKTDLEEASSALELIGDIAFDRDGYTGNADKLAELIDELYSYAKNPKKAHFFNYPEVK